MLVGVHDRRGSSIMKLLKRDLQVVDNELQRTVMVSQWSQNRATVRLTSSTSLSSSDSCRESVMK